MRYAVVLVPLLCLACGAPAPAPLGAGCAAPGPHAVALAAAACEVVCVGSHDPDGTGHSWYDCDGVAADGCEVDALADAANCGACGYACRPGVACVGGACGGVR